MGQQLPDGRLRSACARHGIAVEEGDEGLVSIETALALASKIAMGKKLAREQAWARICRLLGPGVVAGAT